MGRTAASERGWGPCLVTVGWAGAGFFSSSHQICPIFQCLLGCTPWCSHGHLGVGCSPGTTRSRDPSHHGITDLGIKPRTTRFPAGTTSPGNSQDLQRASAPGGASGKHLSMGGDPSHKPRVCWGSPCSQLSREPPGLPAPCPALTASPAGPGTAGVPALPAEPPFPAGDQNKHFCGEVHCSGARNK